MKREIERKKKENIFPNKYWSKLIHKIDRYIRPIGKPLHFVISQLIKGYQTCFHMKKTYLLHKFHQAIQTF